MEASPEDLDRLRGLDVDDAVPERVDAVRPVDVEIGGALESRRNTSEPRMSVHPRGRCIIASTNSGFRRRVAFPPAKTSLSGRDRSFMVDSLAPPERQSRDVGVGSLFALSCSLRLVVSGVGMSAPVSDGLPSRTSGSLERRASADVGVGKRSFARADRLAPLPRPFSWCPELAVACVVGVGNSALPRLIPPYGPWPCIVGPFASLAVGVGRRRTTASVSVTPAWRPLSRVQFPAVPDAVASLAVGVGRSPVACSATVPDPCLPFWFARVVGVGKRS